MQKVKIIFIGQAPPKTIRGRPFGRSALYKWFESVGITLDVVDECFEFGALIDYFPGLKGKSHAIPTIEQINEARPRLKEQLLKFNPQIVVPIGKLSIGECLDIENFNLSDYIGKEFSADPYKIFDRNLVVIPFPHPSGASTWIYQKGNKELLNKALKLINDHLQI
ncbi:MAG: uracil-DNA glycosylase family protein [Candidatus Dojkabacteria bacterium]